jgi:branched-subunit amino acid aminotransferase/4-amino-4-deoxychorismate lyase
MIWIGGRIVPDEAMTIPAADRVCEHGIGLFETLRTWDGVAKLLPRHRARMIRSAADLGLPLVPTALPDPEAVARLLRTVGGADGGDVLLRITLSGGRSDGGGSRVWMRHAPLPPPSNETGAAVTLAPWTVAEADPLARHKTLNYWSKRLAFEQGRAAGADEVLLATPDGRIWEGSRTNLFLVRDGTLITPDLGGPVLPGIMRGLVLEKAAELGLETRQRGVSAEDLDRADEVFLTNAVRGLIPVGRTPGRTVAVPGPWMLRIKDRIEQWLREGGDVS